MDRLRSSVRPIVTMWFSFMWVWYTFKVGEPSLMFTILTTGCLTWYFGDRFIQRLK